MYVDPRHGVNPEAGNLNLGDVGHRRKTERRPGWRLLKFGAAQFDDDRTLGQFPYRASFLILNPVTLKHEGQLAAVYMW